MAIATEPARRRRRPLRSPTGSERVAPPSLGWAALAWIAEYLPSPSDERQPFILTDEQAHLLLRWYEVDDHGDYIYRRAIIEMAKGWGKSPLVAAIALFELAGPCIFDGWDAAGQPVGRYRGLSDHAPLVQLAAVSEDQTENTYGVIYQMLTANSGRAAERIKIDIGRTRLYLFGKPGELHPVTASAGSREGQRLQFAVLDETHLWTPSNRGVELAATLRRNTGKMNGRTIETTNAPRLGDRSVAERSEADVRRGFGGILHYARRPSIEPQPDWTDDAILEALGEAYGDAHWIDQGRILKEIRDPSTDWGDALRFYFNIRSAGANRAVDPRRWDELAKRQDVPNGTLIGAGFDGSDYHDWTVIRACTREGYSFLIGVWNPKDYPNQQVPHEAVHQAVAEMFATYKVGRMLCDPPRWQTDIEQWVAKYGEDVVAALETAQARRIAPIVDRWRTAIRAGTHTHDGDPLTSEHVKNANLEPVRLTDSLTDDRTMYRLIKSTDSLRIDAAIADALAYEAAMTMPEPKRSGQLLTF